LLVWDVEGYLLLVIDIVIGVVIFYLYDVDGVWLICCELGVVMLMIGDIDLWVDIVMVVKFLICYYFYGGCLVVVWLVLDVWFIVVDLYGIGEVDVNGFMLVFMCCLLDLFGVLLILGVGWIGEKGFVGGMFDVMMGLMYLGVWEYEVVMGWFVFVDLVLDLGDL